MGHVGHVTLLLGLTSCPLANILIAWSLFEEHQH